jgi:hypothetical protein
VPVGVFKVEIASTTRIAEHEPAMFAPERLSNPHPRKTIVETLPTMMSVAAWGLESRLDGVRLPARHIGTRIGALVRVRWFDELRGRVSPTAEV